MRERKSFKWGTETVLNCRSLTLFRKKWRKIMRVWDDCRRRGRNCPGTVKMKVLLVTI